MPDPERPSFRVVGPAPAETRRRGPGLAVVAISVYALLFFAALWLFHYRAKESKAHTAPPRPDRPALMSGAGLPDAARQKYLQRLAADHCDCGCDMTIGACLARDQTCVRSPELAGARIAAAR